MSIEVLSASLRQRIANTIDSIIRVYDASGALVNFYGQPAINDDGIDNLDSLLQDVRLPADGTYYIEVDTFAVTPATDTDTGSYELFVYSYADPQADALRLGGRGDTLIGGDGHDILAGSTGDDRYVGNLQEDTFIGYVPEQDVTGPANTPPVATVTLNTATPSYKRHSRCNGDHGGRRRYCDCHVPMVRRRDSGQDDPQYVGADGHTGPVDFG